MSRPPRATLTRSVAPGVHRLAHAEVSAYLIEDGDAVTLVDAGLPRMWQPLQRALAAIGRRPADVRALVLTHAHFDHVGVARRVQEEWGVPVLGHPLEHHLAAHPYDYAHEDPRLPYPLTHPAGLPLLGSMLLAGALAVPGVEGVRSIAPGDVLDVPGSPVVVFSPGHTWGHCALHLPDRDALITGDALVTLDPYNARTGPRVVAGAATADIPLALASLDALAATGAGVLLPGHGDPWRGGAVAAVEAARTAGRPD
ncbi:MBL fold metallo-hydrolase [Amnibacterium setariae]|uniref:MBL fold metallo-hydrolase n=1 Tax=Amnibacterium setariae TaxID=2306585 RepID=A0A3A1U7C6_9MICO|nr:MBL fold metallo-hydrolase [Amnibacterium setariae]RIX30189.1 MBL fold metallo-hydrolase [Amnibacterium setariae]